MPTDPLAPPDPFSRDDILSMTHQPEAPNPVPGIVKPAMDYLTSGDMMPAHKPGTQPKDYLRELLQYPDIMAKNIEQASNFAGMAGTLKGGMGAPLKAPKAAPRYLITSPEGKSYVLKHSLSEQLQELGGDWHSRPVIDAQGNVIHNPINSQHVSGPILRLNEDGTLTKGILAYHGSPHDFEKFDLSKIGTGEGAQAYGHGLYFAENEGVAQSYKQGGFQHMPEAVSVAEDKGRWAVYVGGRKKAVTYASKDEASAAADEIAKEIAPKGKTYQVGINADPEHFIQYDKPMGEQSKHVKDALTKLGVYPDEITDEYIASRTTEQGRNAAIDARELANRTLAKPAGEVISRLYPTPTHAARNFKQAGIPGIKYLDQGSRGTFDLLDLQRSRAYWEKNPGAEADQRIKEIDLAIQKEKNKPRTSNYVVFDDKLIDILKKYGWAGLGLPAMGSALPSEKNQ